MSDPIPASCPIRTSRGIVLGRDPHHHGCYWLTQGGVLSSAPRTALPSHWLKTYAAWHRWRGEHREANELLLALQEIPTSLRPEPDVPTGSVRYGPVAHVMEFLSRLWWPR